MSASLPEVARKHGKRVTGSIRNLEHRNEGRGREGFLCANQVDIFGCKRDNFWPGMTDRQASFDGTHRKFDRKAALKHGKIGWGCQNALPLDSTVDAVTDLG